MATTTGERAVSHLKFALALHRALAPDPRGQVCWSPFSVVSALGLLARGARGPSRDELVAVLGELDGLVALLAGAGQLAPAIGGADVPVLAVSNTLWADASIDIEPSFTGELGGWSGGAVRNAPFQAEPEKARDVINADVAETTRQLIPELLPAGAIAADTVSALVNALYLKCAWQHRFVESATAPAPFHTPAGPVRVPMMMLTEQLGYAERGGWQVVALPAAGDVEAVVLLPDGDLGTAEPELDGRSLAALLAAPRQRQVALRLPRLRLTTRAELSDPLRALGVHTVFTDEADLSAISPRRLAVQAVLHESVLKIDEQGLEGAAATAVMMRLLAMPARPVAVTVDRPFLLVVRHAATGAVYFLARVTNPT